MQGVGTNRYAYSFNDPVNFRDPGGNRTFWEGVKDLFSTEEERLQNNTQRVVYEIAALAGNEATYAAGNISEEGYLQARRQAENRLDRYLGVIENNGGSSLSAFGAVFLGALDNGVFLTGGGGHANRYLSSALAIRISTNPSVRNGAVIVLTTSQGTFIGLSKMLPEPWGLQER